MIHTDAGRCTRARDRHWTEWASAFPETHGRMDCSTSLYHVYAGPVIVFGSVCPERVFSISAPSTLSKQITEAQPFLHCSLKAAVTAKSLSTSAFLLEAPATSWFQLLPSDVFTPPSTSTLICAGFSLPAAFPLPLDTGLQAERKPHQ